MADAAHIRWQDLFGQGRPLFIEGVHRLRGSGFYVMDADECASRRIELGPQGDPDPGPIAMGEASDEDDAIVLAFAS